MEEQEVRYILAQSRPQRVASHGRVRRVLVVSVVTLLFLWAAAVSLSALVEGAHWWGVGATPTGAAGGAWRITWVDRGLARDEQVIVGTLVQTVDGAPPTSEVAINQATTLRLLSPGQTTPRLLSWAPSQLNNLLSLSWIVVGAVSLLLGVLVYLHATERALALRFLGLWVGVSLAEVLEPATAFGNLLAEHAADMLTAGLAVGLLVDFLWQLLLPVPSRARWLLDLLLLPGLGVNVLYLIAIQTRQPDELDAALRGYNAVLALGVVLALGLILRVSVRRQASVARERGRTLLGGMVLGLLPLVVLTALPVLVVGYPLVLGQISSLSLIALPLAFAYAILRRDLLRVDSLIRNTVLVLLTVIGMSLLAVLLSAFLQQLPDEPALIIGVSAGAVLAPFVLAGARWLTEAWLFPQVRRYRLLIAQGEIIERTGLDPQRIVGQLVGEVHLALPVRQVTVFALEKHTEQLREISVEQARTRSGEQVTTSPTPRYVDSLISQPPSESLGPGVLFVDEMLSARLLRERDPLLVEAEPTKRETAESYHVGKPQKTMTAPMTGPNQTSRGQPSLESWHLLVPMRVRRRLVAVLALSRREDDQAYSETDLRWLRYLTGRLALALDYALLYEDLYSAYERREELDRLKDQFIITAHHELRTPLTGVQGFLELLRELGPEGRAMNPQKVELFIERACTSAEELSTQLDSLLHAAETSVLDDLHPGPVEIRAVVQLVVNELEAVAQLGRHRVLNQIPPDLVVLGDAKAVSRVFVNLLSNALKYSPPGRPVLFEGQVRVVSAPQKGSAKPLGDGEAPSGSSYVPMAEIMVRDWGYGIEPKHLDKIFERFTRLERDLNSPVRGSGLGLAICRELVSWMGGSIHAESGGTMLGSTFFVRLPLSESATPGQSDSAS